MKNTMVSKCVRGLLFVLCRLWIAVLVVICLGLGWLLCWGLAPAVGPGTEVVEEAPLPEYTCSMHPSVRSTDPHGKCPICFMDLILVPTGSGSGDGPPSLVLDAASRARIRLETSPVERRPIDMEVRMVGKIAHDETRLADITAWVPGRLDRLYVDYTGIEVQDGDHLVQLWSPELYGAQEELLQAARAAATLDAGGEDVLRDRVHDTLDAARERLRQWGLTEAQVAEVEAADAPADHVTIYAPKGGVVVRKLAQQGMYVQRGTPIYTIADLDHLWMNLEAYESDLQWLRYGQPVAFTTQALPGEEFHGTIAFLAPELDERTRTVRVRVNVENTDRRLKPGMFVRASVHAAVAAGGKVMAPALAGSWICPMHPEVVAAEAGICDVCEMDLVPVESLGYVTAEAEGAAPPLVIPKSAPLLTGARALVYVETRTDTEVSYSPRTIVLGPRAGNSYVVKSGLEEGEIVVTHGAFKLDSELQIRGEPSMMSPAEETAPEEVVAPPAITMLGPDEVPAAFRATVGGMWRAYLALHAALAGDDFYAGRAALDTLEAARAAVDMSLLSGATHMTWMAQAMDLDAGLAKARATTEIEGLRAAFEEVYLALRPTVLTFGIDRGEVFEVECPMAFDFRGARWLQDNDDILNPYFGESMLKCGTVLGRRLPAPEEE